MAAPSHLRRNRRAAWRVSLSVKLPLACAAASLVGALTACGPQTAGQASLQPLQLSDAGVAAEGRAAVAPGMAGSGNAGFRLSTTLPTGIPAPAPVWRLPTVTATDAGRVADALGISGSPTRVAGGWVMRKAGKLLGVRTDGSWTWGMDCSPSAPIEQEPLDVMCASASGGGVAVAPATPGGRPAPPLPTPTIPPGPTQSEAQALAAPIFQRLGWASAVVDVAVGAPTTSVTARRTVASTPTADWLTTLEFQGSGQLVSGSGYVGEPVRGKDYPLVSAARAYQLLLAQPRAMPEICQVRKDGKPGCAPSPPTVITAATLGLALRHDLGRPVLVPAWLFTVRGTTQPLTVIAVDPRWLKPPATTVPLPLPAQSVNPAGPATVKPS